MRFLSALMAIVLCWSCSPKNYDDQNGGATMVIPGTTHNKLNHQWRQALIRRQNQRYIDSISSVQIEISPQEEEWIRLIESKVDSWTTLKDSLRVPFGNVKISDTTYVLLGVGGYDDGFTYEFNTVCFDVTALNREYGKASDPVNDNRMDRLFAHEYTHLLHKEWARQNNFAVKTFKDSILWECIYEGIGMYRSMSKKWFPVNGDLSSVAAETLEKLYPIFAERLSAIDTAKHLTDDQKVALHKNLSRGSMKQKWGALPVGIWLALEAKGNDENLQQWIANGPNAIIPLANKYLPDSLKARVQMSK